MPVYFVVVDLAFTDWSKWCMSIPITFYATDQSGAVYEVASYTSNNIPRVGELAIFRTVEDGEDSFSDYKVIEVMHRYLVDEDKEATVEFCVVTLADYEAEES